MSFAVTYGTGISFSFFGQNFKTMKKVFFLLFFSVLLLSSCSTERRALGQMRTLTQRIEAHGDQYDMDDWQDALEQYKAIDEKMDETKLTQEQAQEYGELKGRCIAKFAKSKVEDVVNGITKYIKEGSGFLKGILGGILGE